MVLVTVQIITFNSANTIKKCLNSVKQQRGVEIEIFVLDNASTDSSVQILQTFGIPIIQNNRNQGYSAGHNRLLQCSNSAYVLTLNPDSWLEPDFLIHIIEKMQEEPRIGSAAGCLLRVDSFDEAPYCVDGAGLFMRSNRRQGLRAEGQSIASRPTQSSRIFGPDGAAAVYRREMLEDIRIQGSVFDEDFFFQKEDIDLAWRAQLRGWESVYVPESLGYHIRSFRPRKRHHVAPEIRAYATCNRYRLIIKNDHWDNLRHDWLAIIIYDLQIIIYLILFERQSLQSLLLLWRSRQSLLAKRRLIQESRSVSAHQMQNWFTKD